MSILNYLKESLITEMPFVKPLDDGEEGAFSDRTTKAQLKYIHTDDMKLDMSKLRETKNGYIYNGKLLDVVKFDSLFDRYKDSKFLKDMKLDLRPHSRGGGHFDSTGREIVVRDSTIKDITDTLVHEIQHLLQYLDKRTRGANPTARGTVDTNSLFTKEDKQILKLSREIKKLYKSQGDFESKLKEYDALIKQEYREEDKYFGGIGGVYYMSPKVLAYFKSTGEIEAREAESRHNDNDPTRDVMRGISFPSEDDKKPKKFRKRTLKRINVLEHALGYRIACNGVITRSYSGKELVDSGVLEYENYGYDGEDHYDSTPSINTSYFKDVVFNISIKHNGMNNIHKYQCIISSRMRGYTLIPATGGTNHWATVENRRYTNPLKFDHMIGPHSDGYEIVSIEPIDDVTRTKTGEIDDEFRNFKMP